MDLKCILSLFCGIVLEIGCHGDEWYDWGSSELLDLYFMDYFPLRSAIETCHFLVDKTYKPGEYEVIIHSDSPTLDLYSDNFLTIERINNGLEYKVINLGDLTLGFNFMKYKLKFYGWRRPNCWCLTPGEDTNHDTSTASPTRITKTSTSANTVTPTTTLSPSSTIKQLTTTTTLLPTTSETTRRSSTTIISERTTKLTLPTTTRATTSSPTSTITSTTNMGRSSRTTESTTSSVSTVTEITTSATSTTTTSNITPPTSKQTTTHTTLPTRKPPPPPAR